MKSFSLVFIFCSLSVLNLYSQSNVKTEKISIFTDGNSFIMKSIKLTPERNKFVLKENLIPKARFGSLLISDKDNSIESIKSYVDTILTPSLLSTVSTSSYVDVLKANLNKVVTITMKEKTRIGEVIKIIYQNSNSPSHIIFKEKTEYNLIRIYDIINISFSSRPEIPSSEIKQIDPYYNYNKKETDLKLNILLEFNNSDPKEVSMKYLQRGVSWTPFYYLELDDNRNIASLILKAEVINDSEEIKDSDLELFIGQPNFEYSDHLSDLIDFVNLLNPDYDAGLGENSIFSTHYAASSNGKNRPSQNQSKNYQDFYIYNIKNESLKKNSRAHFTLFETDLEYSHIYQCDLLNINHQINTRKKEDNTVYHSLRFMNKTKNLLGEGPVTIIDDTDKKYVPLAQSKLEYTPSNAIGLIKITETPEIEVTQKEEVMDLDQNLMNFGGRNYRKARIKVIVKITNFKDEKIDLILRQEVFGEVKESQSFKLLEKKEKYYLPNAVNHLEWNLQLNPNENKEIVYEYEYFRL